MTDEEYIPSDEEINAYISYLIEEGAMELVSMNEDGEPIYRFTERCKEIAPDLYAEAEQDFGTSIMTLWQGGYVEILWPGDEDPLITLTELAFDDDMVDLLEDDVKETLYEIIRQFAERVDALDDSV